MSDDEIFGRADHLPAVISSILGIPIPGGVENLPIPPEFAGAHACVVFCIDNFGLAEIVNFKPKALIKFFFQRLIMLETSYPDAESMTNYVIQGRPTHETLAPNLFEHVRNQNKTVQVIDRQTFIDTYVQDSSIPRSVVTQDMQAWTAANKAINRHHLVFVRFTDLDVMYQRYKNVQPPQDIIKKALDRTSNWLKIIHKQAIAGTVFLVIGNFGTKTTIGLDYGEQGRQVKWRKANVPIGLLSLKHESG